MSERQCGDCQLCCKLLPMQANRDQRVDVTETKLALVELGVLTKHEAQIMTSDFDKPAGKRCPHQRHGKGCVIYRQRPFGCRMWNCVWLANDDADDLSRPDRAHYVIDPSPDFVTCEDDGTSKQVGVVQVWLDPDYPDAHKDPALRAYLERRAEKDGYVGLIRTTNSKGFVLIPPKLGGGKWIEKHSNVCGPEHSTADKIAALGQYQVILR